MSDRELPEFGTVQTDAGHWLVIRHIEDSDVEAGACAARGLLRPSAVFSHVCPGLTAEEALALERSAGGNLPAGAASVIGHTVGQIDFLRPAPQPEPREGR